MFSADLYPSSTLSLTFHLTLGEGPFTLGGLRVDYIEVMALSPLDPRVLGMVRTCYSPLLTVADLVDTRIACRICSRKTIFLR